MNMMLNHADVLAAERELCKRSFSDYVKQAWPQIEPAHPYVHNWHMDCIGDHLTAVANGELNRLLFNVPPGTSKSTSVAIMFPTWLWGPQGSPSNRFIGASHEAGLATRDNRKCRLLIESDWYQALWPIELTTDQNEKTFFENTSTGFRQAVAVKSMTGRRGDNVLWDDPLSPEKAYSEVERETAIRVFDETLPTRLNSPEHSSVTIMMQRLHENDPSGHILEGDYGYTHVVLPMEYEPGRFFTMVKPSFMVAPEKVDVRYSPNHKLWFKADEPIPDAYKDTEHEILDCPIQSLYDGDPRTEEGELLFEGRFPAEVVARDKKVMGEFAVAGQFQQRPSPRGGGMFPVERFVITQSIVNEYDVVERVRYWDKAGTAGGGAYTAGVRMAKLRNGQYVVEHVVRKQLSSMDREALLLSTAETDPDDTAIWIEQEPGSGGKESAENTIRMLAGYAAYIDRVTGDKVSRATPYSAQVQGGNIVLVKGAWNQPFKDEHEGFPNGKYKDQVDAAAGAFMKLTHVGKTAGVLF
jgi:predicted phage terminase large subunit-like protein